MTEMLLELLNDAVSQRDSMNAKMISAVSGKDLPRADGSTYNYASPLKAIDRLFVDLVAAQTRGDLAEAILSSVGQTDEYGKVLSIEDATRRVVMSHQDRAYFGRSGTKSDREVAEAQEIEVFISELNRELRSIDRARARRQESLAKKTAENIDPYSEAQQALAVILTDGKMRAALDPMALEQALRVFNLSESDIAAAVDADERAADEKRTAEFEAERAKRLQRLANECQESVVSSWGNKKCSKTAKYKVVFEDGTETQICGTHAHSKYSSYKVGREIWSDGELRVVASIEER